MKKNRGMLVRTTHIIYSSARLVMSVTFNHTHLFERDVTVHIHNLLLLVLNTMGKQLQLNLQYLRGFNHIRSGNRYN